MSFPASTAAARVYPSCSRQGCGARSSRPRGASCLLLELAAWELRGRRYISSSSRKQPNYSISPTPKLPRQRSFPSPTRRASTSLLLPESRFSPSCIGTAGNLRQLFVSPSLGTTRSRISQRLRRSQSGSVSFPSRITIQRSRGRSASCTPKSWTRSNWLMSSAFRRSFWPNTTSMNMGLCPHLRRF